MTCLHILQGTKKIINEYQKMSIFAQSDWMKWLNTTHVCFLQFSHPAIFINKHLFLHHLFLIFISSPKFPYFITRSCTKEPYHSIMFSQISMFRFLLPHCISPVYHSLLIFLLFHPSTPPGIDFGLFIFTRNIKQEKNWGVLDENRALCRCYRIKVH